MEITRRSIRLMGTTITISILHQEAELILDQAVDLLHLYKNRFSANDDDSELMAVNKAAGLHPVKVHPDLFELIAIGKEHSLAPDSHLNIAIGPLVQSWRIGFADARVPSVLEIASALLLIDPNEIHLFPDSSEVFLGVSGMKIDLGALAKGYIADKIGSFLRQEGVEDAIINLGGNVLTLGQHPLEERPWHIGIQLPDEKRGEHLTSLAVANQSVVTSGIYERRLVVNGKTYHHIFNDKTGYPMETDVTSLTIVSDKSVDGEIWTTRLFGSAAPSIIEQVESQEGIEALVITQDQRIYMTTGIISKIV